MAIPAPTPLDCSLDELLPISRTEALLLDTYAAVYPAEDDWPLAEAGLSRFPLEQVNP